jgi:hypothetical protein
VAHDSAATTIDVLANDTDTDSGPKLIDQTSTPAHGTVASTVDDLTYQPDAGFCGTGTFTYTLVPGGSTATVTVTVTCPPDTTAPDTKIKRHPRKRTRSRKATFRFTSTEAHSTFMCKLDKRPFKRCSSPKTYNVKPGRHTFKVKAIDAAANADRTPAAFHWRVLRPRH